MRERKPSSVSLSKEDLKAPITDAVIVYEAQPRLEDCLREDDRKVLPVCMDEFVRQEPAPLAKQEAATSEYQSEHEDSFEFPDLLGSESSFNDIGGKAKSETFQDNKSGLTFATLSEVSPNYPEEEKVPLVVAKKSAAPAVAEVKSNAMIPPPESAKELVTAIASEAVAQLSKAKISLPTGTSLVPAASGTDESDPKEPSIQTP